MFSQLPRSVAQYLVVTASYWAFTLTDGALRMLVVLYFHGLGYSPLQVATLFLLYEFFGVVTNLVGGWLAARIGLNLTMHMGLGLQIVALGMLAVEPSLLGVAYVMVAQALSGIAKDLNKMSAKSSIKTLIPDDQQGQLYRWVALLTGSKNTLKGVGFFLGAVLMTWLGFRGAVAVMAAALAIVLVTSFLLLDRNLGKTSFKPKFQDLLSKSGSINRLSAARLFLFGARDVWFVVALPVFLQSRLGWSHTAVGSLLAVWVIGYGIVQAQAPRLTGQAAGRVPDGHAALWWAMVLSGLPALIAVGCWLGWPAEWVVVSGLLAFGGVFAINSAVHSYLIVSYAKADGVSLDVGFYYMANAAGRLLGTVLSGSIYQFFGLEACLLASSLMVLLAALASTGLPRAARVTQ
ncbi:organoarsenical effux MFS transporter ArsJ [Pseudomaricurvus alkylphenolicus]|uniref:organoarsenical effux MFS transporter ArsJ n=1 Tax=Pseudomaricurvus alkylphenolicus TaxID=1306991 RepID=UPI00141E2A09|nr:organoarsenical effux MFS transporter ArsJ [Pseudomaricurvus alkylphenolicus]NIB39290.1 organoarsenical effux MFS transporter ArsJ [Pseudomaricurvus alkylphenolicus]